MGCRGGTFNLTVSQASALAAKGYKFLGGRKNFIRGDVIIYGGNSGRPLYDGHGNIVGLSVAGLNLHQGKRNAELSISTCCLILIRMSCCVVQYRRKHVFSRAFGYFSSVNEVE
ncbi:MAG: S1C family serine protease [Nitrosomonas sp.]|nr:S1C family serine protease [Nitrosomonas sp.]